MKKLKIIIAALCLMALPIFAWVGVAGALAFTTNVDDGQTIDSSLYSAGQDINIKGTINGDVFCAGQNVKIDATVNGDIICAGQTVTIKGQVEGDIRVAGQSVTVDAQIMRNATVAAQTFSLDSQANIEGDATLSGGSLNLNGSVGRDALFNGQDVTLNGSIGRDAQANVESLEVKAGTDILGMLTYTSNNDAQIATGAKIGEVTHNTPEKPSGAILWGLSTGLYLYTLAAFLLLGLLITLFFPQAVRRTGDVARKHFGKTLLTGFLASIIVPIVVFALAVTFVGLPLALMLALIWGLVMIVTIPVAAYFYAKLLFRKVKNTVGLMVIGILILVTLLFVPFVGFALLLVSSWIGAGAMLIAIKKAMPKPEYKG